MASSDKDSCANDPDFAVICAFLEKFSEQLQVNYPDFKQLQDWLSNTDEVPNGLRDLHIKLMRKTRRTVHECAWESALCKFCFSYSSQDGWEIERFGYKKSSLKVKLRILRELLESQFDRNNKFRAKLLTMTADSLRNQPIGRDKLGHAYWLTQDPECNIRIYQEHLDEEIWQVVATNREDLVKLISRLRGNEVVLPSEIGFIDEDSSSNSCSVPIDKPPPPEEKDDSQESNQSTEVRIPNIKIKLGKKENGIVVKSQTVTIKQDKEEDIGNEREAESVEQKQEEKKVKPLIISQSKIKFEKPKKRSLNELKRNESQEPKKQRPSLLDSKREKKISKYEECGNRDETAEKDKRKIVDKFKDDEDKEGKDSSNDEPKKDLEEILEHTKELELGDTTKSKHQDKLNPDKDGTKNFLKENVSVILSEIIEDPMIQLSEEGQGADCENSVIDFLNDSHCKEESEYSEAIEESVLYIRGEGTGSDCFVGNNKTNEEVPKATFFFGQPGCLKLSPVKSQLKIEEPEKSETGEKTSEQINGENHLDEFEKTENVSKEEENNPKDNPEQVKTNKENPEQNESLKKSTINRKRRLREKKLQKQVHHCSETETDLGSENVEEQLLDLKDEDIGGKRLKMRNKKLNTGIRKKIEAQRKTISVEETTGSSGEEDRPRKEIVNKKFEKETEKKMPFKGMLKQTKSLSNETTNDLVELMADSEEISNEKNTKYSPPSKTVDVLKKENNEILQEDKGLLQEKPSNAAEKTLCIDTKIDKKTHLPEQVTKTSSLEVKRAKKIVKAVEEETIVETPLENPSVDQYYAEKQRKRRSSEEELRSNKDTSPPPVLIKITRSSRRNGPLEHIKELPQTKRTRVKLSNSVVEKPQPTASKAEFAKKNKVEESNEVEKSNVNNDIEGPHIKTEFSKSITYKKEEVLLPRRDNEEKLLIDDKNIKTFLNEGTLKEEENLQASKDSKSEVSLHQRQQAAQKQPASSQRRKYHDEVDTKNIIDLESDTTPVRMSRRIAQLKIREEADRRKMEEIALRNMKAELKKKKKAEGKSDDPTVSEPSEHSSDNADSEVEIKKKTEKKKKCPGKGGWSSGSEEPEEEEEEEHPYESDHGSPLFRSDHEFSPESELEDESQVVPLKRARTAKKEGDEIVEADNTDESCQKCGKSDHPEWILLCDKCNKGYHCSCLSPVIFYIPEGDWFCPPCQQEILITALENHLIEFDNLVIRKKKEDEEKLRIEMETKLALENAAQAKKKEKYKKKQARKNKIGESQKKTYQNQLSKNMEESGENENETDVSVSSKSSSSGSESSSSKSESASNSDDEPIYKLRKRRQINVSYRLNEYDHMIKTALKEEYDDDVPEAGNLGRGKDISTIIEADKENKLRQEQKQFIGENGEISDYVAKLHSSAAVAEDSGSEFEPLKRKPKKSRNLRKKQRKLTKLDISSEGDDSDEDFKTSSMDDDEEEDDDEEVTQSSDSSLEVYRRRHRGRNKNKSRRAARHSARERRKDRRFIVEDSDVSSEEVRPQLKKKRKKDSDYTESETNDDEDDEISENIDSEDLCDDSTDSEASDGAWCPSKRKKQRSNAIARKSPKLKQKQQPKTKKQVNDNNHSLKAGISKNRMIRDDSDDEVGDDSVDSSRKTRGKRCTYLEDYEDESSDGGIKPGVKRPDTPPEEREQFIKKQEEIKRMLAEKNAEGAKLAATPRLVPIKGGSQRSPAKLDSLSTVPPSVIRQAKVLDIDYLQRKGESISEGDLDESEFDDDDLPDDFNPEDMDEEAIARMVEEEDFAQQQLKLPVPSEVKKKQIKDIETLVRPSSSYGPNNLQQSTSSSASGLQEPVRKKLPMPTMHPPLLRHGFGTASQQIFQNNRSSAPPNLPLLQNALSAPLNHPINRNYTPTTQAIPATQGMGPDLGAGLSASGDPNKPRGRRKKITPLRDPLQKQQAAAAASAAAAAAVKPKVDNLHQNKEDIRQSTANAAGSSASTGVIKSALSIAQPPQLYKPPPANNQPSVITRMPHIQGRSLISINGPLFSEQGPRFYGPVIPQSHQHQPHTQLQNQLVQRPPTQAQSIQQRHTLQTHSQQRQSSQPQNRPPTPSGTLVPGSRPPLRHRGAPLSVMNSHHAIRPTYGPPPLRPSAPISLTNNVREQGPLRQSYSGPEQQYGPPPPRHSTPPHLSPYRPQMFNNPGFIHRGTPPTSSQSQEMRPARAPASYTSSFIGGYGYYTLPLPVTISAPLPHPASAVPSSVIVSASSLSSTSTAAIPPPQQTLLLSRASVSPPSIVVEIQTTPVGAAISPSINTPSVIEVSQKKLTTLETFNTTKTGTPPPLAESSESRSPCSSNPTIANSVDDIPEEGSKSPLALTQSTSEFSGLVSYFSSQHDDLNT